MPIDVLMPALSPTMTEGTLAKWVKKEGDSVASGDVIAEIETDKATMEVEAVDEGTIGKILVDEGSENVVVNSIIAVLLEDGEDKSALDSYEPEAADEPGEAEAQEESADEPEEEEEDDGEDAQDAVIPAGVKEILMPALSPTMEEGTLANWTKKAGDKVSSGDVIAEIETDKATMEVESVDDGTIGKILVEAGGAPIKVNTPIALLLEDGADKKALDKYQPAKAGTKKPKAQKAEKKATASNAPAPQAQASGYVATKAPEPPAASTIARSGDEVKASPLAKKLAAENNIALTTIRGSGPGGRIIKADVEEAIAGGSVQRDVGEFVQVKNSTMRKTIAKRLSEAKQQIPHFYLSTDCELDKLLDVRKQLNAKAAAKDVDNPAYKLSVNDLVIKAAALALVDVPEANASWYDDAIVQYSNVDVSIAVATDSGLITPIIKNADQKGLPAISNEMKALAKKAREGTLQPEEYQGGGFSISNLGMFGIKQFSAIINPPQSCILAVGAGEPRAVPRGNGVIDTPTVMTVTLSVDHRSVDGAVGAQYLQAFKQYIESPALLLV